MTKKIHIIGGGTYFHVRPHLALAAPAHGRTAAEIDNYFRDILPSFGPMSVELHLTRMAGGSTDLETSADVARLVDQIIADPDTKIVVMNAAICDYEASMNGGCGKDLPRLRTREDKEIHLTLRPAPKIIGNIRKHRKDIFAVGFKMTLGASTEDQYATAMDLLKEASLNLVLANDTGTRQNMIVTPEESRYAVTTNRHTALSVLAHMTYERSKLTFTHSTVVPGELVSWNSPEVPESLRAVVNHCIRRGAYKLFRGSTVGHFAFKVKDNQFVTSIRKTNFNELDKVGMVRVDSCSDDEVIAYGAKPSVGGQSQRRIFRDHPEYDCIAHFHCPIWPESSVPRATQQFIECGSHQCGENASRNLKRFGNLSAVYLDEHGPNIVFHRSINPQEVIDFIETNFDLEHKTGGELHDVRSESVEAGHWLVNA